MHEKSEIKNKSDNFDNNGIFLCFDCIYLDSEGEGES